MKSSVCVPAGEIEHFLSKLSCFLVVEFKKDEYTVGRDASCSLVINESYLNKADINLVSKKHFKISHKKDGVYLEGYALTYVNEKKIGPSEKTILKHNDRIAIGKLHLKGKYCCEVDVHKAQRIETSSAYLPLTSKFCHYITSQLMFGRTLQTCTSLSRILAVLSFWFNFNTDIGVSFLGIRWKKLKAERH